MNIVLNADATAKLREVLENEGKDAVVRIRETKVGSACKSKYVLRLSIDTVEDDDMKATIGSIPFAVNQDLADQYGTNFSVTLDAEGALEVKVAQ